MKKYIQFQILNNDDKLSMNNLLHHIKNDYLEYGINFKILDGWFIEFSDIDTPIREIEIKNGEVASRAPNNENSGFWLNTKLCENDLQVFSELFVMSESDFEETWKRFDKMTFGFEIEIKKFHFIHFFDYNDENDDEETDYSYLRTIIKYKGKRRVLRIYFHNEDGDNIISSYNFYDCSKLQLRGRLVDHRIDEDLYLYESELIE
ncbi:hypothetical protein [Flavobacterium limi]|uniref:Immunity protein 22 n=1 Tax=Flavobacterium limi TaxID=2045105 RepID=A0ABQ1UP81_9FLAO|nr:hypothetical protein [Flavobacterium limi]GGF23461.1 hypothetical protein GCM10011518_35970 [Flavobacterium limi]